MYIICNVCELFVMFVNCLNGEESWRGHGGMDRDIDRFSSARQPPASFSFVNPVVGCFFFCTLDFVKAKCCYSSSFNYI
jgi:hypothetical protein